MNDGNKDIKSYENGIRQKTFAGIVNACIIEIKNVKNMQLNNYCLKDLTTKFAKENAPSSN